MASAIGAWVRRQASFAGYVDQPPYTEVGILLIAVIYSGLDMGRA